MRSSESEHCLGGRGQGRSLNECQKAPTSVIVIINAKTVPLGSNLDGENGINVATVADTPYGTQSNKYYGKIRWLGLTWQQESKTKPSK